MLCDLVITLCTGMHSSRMRIARSLTASRSIRRGACMPGGVHARGVHACTGGGHVCFTTS